MPTVAPSTCCRISAAEQAYAKIAVPVAVVAVDDVEVAVGVRQVRSRYSHAKR